MFWLSLQRVIIRKLKHLEDFELNRRQFYGDEAAGVKTLADNQFGINQFLFVLRISKWDLN